MSHFTVLVPAQDEKELEARLLPYHEYECTGIEAYTEFVPEDMDELKANFAEHGEGRTFDEFVPDWCGAEKNAEGVWGRVTNPNKQWDWWVVGGRWSGTLILKNGAHRADTALAGEVDWDAMQAEQVGEKREKYSKWKSLPKKDEVSEQEYRRALMDADLFWIDIDEVNDLNSMTETEYIAKWGMARAGTFAFIDLGGKWNERARMGWWAMTSDEKPEYHAVWWAFVRSLPADQRVYVVDCHI